MKEKLIQFLQFEIFQQIENFLDRFLAQLINYPQENININIKSLQMKYKIQVGKCFLTRKNLMGSTAPYVSFRSGVHRVKTKVATGSQPEFNQTLQISCDKYLNVKIKDAGLNSCFLGGCGGPFNSLLGQVKINLLRCIEKKEIMTGYYPLTYKDASAGRIFLTITPISQ